MLKANDRVKVKYGKFKGCGGTVVKIDHDFIPPVVIRPDDLQTYQGVFFYEDALEKIQDEAVK